MSSAIKLCGLSSEGEYKIYSPVLSFLKNMILKQVSLLPESLYENLSFLIGLKLDKNSLLSRSYDIRNPFLKPLFILLRKFNLAFFTP